MTCVFILFGVAMYQVLAHYMERSVSESLARRGEEIVGLVAQIKETGEAYVVKEIEARYSPESYDQFIRIIRADGSVLYASGRTTSFDPVGLPISIPLGLKTTIIEAKATDGNKWLISTRAFKGNGNQFWIQTARPLQPIQAILGDVLSSLLLGLPLLVAVVVVGGYFLVGRALAPVAQVANQAELISLHKLSERLPLLRTGDEIEHLSLALNRMIVRLAEAFQQNQRFLADASHELRTPLAALRAELESVTEQARQQPEVVDRIGSSLEEVDRLSKIVEALFAISRLDAGEAKEERKKFDLAKLAANTTDQLCLLAEDKGIVISCVTEHPVNILGDRARIKQVLVNLLDNAIKYTPPKGTVKLRVQTRQNMAVIEVADSGIGIPTAALPHVFERFFRVDEARSRDLGGAGLGLAIVKSICAAHQGRVEASSTPGQGSLFRVELPLANGVQNNSKKKSKNEKPN